MLKAKTVMPDKFWILENFDGHRKGTMRNYPNPIVGNNTVLVNINNVENSYADINSACKELAISFFEDSKSSLESKEESVSGFPTKCAAFNPTWDIKRKLPVFTKTEKSKTLHAAGYYIINFETGWVQSFCPKVSTLDSNEFKGPYKDKLEMREQLRIATNASDFN